MNFVSWLLIKRFLGGWFVSHSSIRGSVSTPLPQPHIHQEVKSTQIPLVLGLCHVTGRLKYRCRNISSYKISDDIELTFMLLVSNIVMYSHITHSYQNPSQVYVCLSVIERVYCYMNIVSYWCKGRQLQVFQLKNQVDWYYHRSEVWDSFGLLKPTHINTGELSKSLEIYTQSFVHVWHCWI